MLENRTNEDFSINYSPLSHSSNVFPIFDTFFENVVENNKKKLDSGGKLILIEDTQKLRKKIDIGSADFDPVIFLRFVHFESSYEV
jgi:hypothetical protein